LAEGRVGFLEQLIAWDIGPGGYQVGAFPPGWAEWNDRFRDIVRDFWARQSLSGNVWRRGCLHRRIFSTATPQAAFIAQFHYRA
jgi:pullulanase/glycogen debranching enzyme